MPSFVCRLLTICSTLLPCAAQTYTIHPFAGADAAPVNVSTSPLIDIRGVGVDSSGNVYFADTGDHRVRRISAAGVMTIVAGTGQAGSQGDNGPASQCRLNSPYGVAVD